MTTTLLETIPNLHGTGNPWEAELCFVSQSREVGGQSQRHIHDVLQEILRTQVKTHPASGAYAPCSPRTIKASPAQERTGRW